MQAHKPEEKTIDRKQVWANLVRILSIRLAILSLLLAAAGFLLPRQDGSFHIFIGLAFVMTVPYALWIRDHVRLHDLAPLQFLVDLVLVSGLVIFTGGLQSPLVLLFPLVIIAAGIVTPSREALQICLLAILCYVTMGVLTLERVLVPSEPMGGMPRMGSSVVTMFFHVFTFAIFGVLSSFLSHRCLYLTPEDLARDLVHWKSSAALASDMAHEVRNPVAAISGCAQVLSHLERKSGRGDEASAILLAAERDRMFKCIVDESERLDRIMEKFLNHAEYTEERLLRLIQLRESEEALMEAGKTPRPVAEKVAV